jgi:hypothetical protein
MHRGTVLKDFFESMLRNLESPMETTFQDPYTTHMRIPKDLLAIEWPDTSTVNGGSRSISMLGLLPAGYPKRTTSGALIRVVLEPFTRLFIFCGEFMQGKQKGKQTLQISTHSPLNQSSAAFCFNFSDITGTFLAPARVE